MIASKSPVITDKKIPIKQPKLKNQEGKPKKLKKTEKSA